MRNILLTLGLLTFLTQAQAQSFDLLVLGTAQDAGYPQAGCEKSCCKAVKAKEGVASVAIQTEGKFWIIDATPDFTAQLQLAKDKFPGSKLEGIFLTHAHIGHYTGLMYLGKEAMNPDSLKVYCMPRMAEFLKNNGPWDQLMKNGNIKVIELKSNEGVRLGSYANITPIEVPHRDEYSETVAYMIASKKKKGIYIPDIDKWENWKISISDYLNFVDFALLDATFSNADELPGRDMKEIPHPLVSETTESFKDLKSTNKQKVYFIHMNHTNPLLWDSAEQARIENLGFRIAKTGLTL
jgi:pyrroloquinoline quinone biosynthesis protein B